MELSRTARALTVHLFAQCVPDVERRFHEARLLRRDVDPAHLAGRWLVAEAQGQRCEVTCAFCQAGEIRRDRFDCVERCDRLFARSPDRPHGVEKVVAGCTLLPAQSQGAAQIAQVAARRDPQIARRAVARAGDVMPGLQSARLLQAGGQQIAREVDDLRRAERRAEELDAGLGQLMGFVEQSCAAAVASE